MMERDGATIGEATALEQRGQLLVDGLNSATPVVSPHSDPRIGIALGGGSARGLTHIPYIEAMDELGLSPSIIAGTSIGALLGSGWANGMTGAELREHSYSVLGTMRVIAGRIWGRRLPSFGSIFRNGVSLQLDACQIVDSFLPDGFPNDFEALKHPLYVVATDFQAWNQAVFSAGPLRPAIAGSIAIPALFKPVIFAGHMLVDGGVVNPLPLDQAACNCDILVGIDANGDPAQNFNRVHFHALDMWLGSAQIMMHVLIANMIAAYPPDVYMRAHVDPFGAFEFWRVREIVEQASQDKDNFKRQVTSKIEAFIANQQKTGAALSPSGLHRAQK